MIEIGRFNKLKVLKQENHGFYLEGDDRWGNILLPGKCAPKSIKIGDFINAFIYLDSEDIVIATTKRPFVQVGEFACLEVKSKAEFGVFLDWGLDKDLFIPFREQLCEMQINKKYVVYVYVDSSDRICASMRINKFISNEKVIFEEGQPVDLLVYQFSQLGVKAIVNGKFSGLIFKDDTIHDLKLGQTTKGYIKNIRPDNKIDLSLRALSPMNLSDLKELILQELKKNGGNLDITSKSSAQEINAIFKVSRKKFKIALGDLYKKRLITTDDHKTYLAKKK